MSRTQLALVAALLVAALLCTVSEGALLRTA